MGNKSSKKQVVNATKFGVQTMLDGVPQGTWEGADALDLLEQPIWDGKVWAEHIPVIRPRPEQFLSKNPRIDNPQFPAQSAQWYIDLNMAIATYLSAMMSDHVTVKIVLLGSADGRTNWFVVNDQKKIEAGFIGFIKREILGTDKRAIIRKMIKI